VIIGYWGACWTRLYSSCRGGFWQVAEGTDGQAGTVFASSGVCCRWREVGRMGFGGLEGGEVFGIGYGHHLTAILGT